MIIQVRKPNNRRGFTLVELLVVIALIAFIAALAVLVAPRASDSQKSAFGASKVQGYLGIAKQRAYRDKVICGVRLLADPTDSTYVTQLEYIEQPNDFTGGQITWTRGTNQVTMNFHCGTSILPNDFLAIFSPPDPNTHKITGITHPSATTTQLTLASNIPIDPALANSGYTPHYRVIRQPRSLTGEPPLEMPSDMVISLRDLANTQDLSQPASLIDILFTPTGEVLIGDRVGGFIPRGKVILYVRDRTRPDHTTGEPSLIVVYCRTGAVAAYPVNTNTAVGDYYHFTKEGRTSGL